MTYVGWRCGIRWRCGIGWRGDIHGGWVAKGFFLFMAHVAMLNVLA